MPKSSPAGSWPNSNSAPSRRSSTQGLHLYLDQLQAKLNAIGAALFDAYIFQAFAGGSEEHLIQQEEQQQQLRQRS